MLKVHLGAFDQSVDGWMNTDVTPHMWVAKIPFVPLLLYKLRLIREEYYLKHQKKAFNKLHYLDITKKFPFAANSVNAVFSSHVIEHLSMNEVKSLIEEIHRCLVPGGICRVVVPDLEKIVNLYNPEHPEKFISEIYEASPKGKYDVRGSHHSAFTGPLLKKLFKAVGFKEVNELSYKVGKCPDLEKLDNRPEESIFFEAIK